MLPLPIFLIWIRIRKEPIAMTHKRTFDIDRFVATIESNYRRWNPPIITFIANRGATPFEVLVSTLLSLRTKDEVTGVAARRLLAMWPVRRKRW
jgi:endonuclease-3